MCIYMADVYANILISVVKGDVIGKSSIRKEHSEHSLIQRNVYVAIMWAIHFFFLNVKDMRA